ncbi:MAG TPA: hypothetical protein VM513_09245 [Kofleriaceae bacterium]|jgi:hypothetical protein|nr:hypothetical protein [Kofleriaceae bacterium]
MDRLAMLVLGFVAACSDVETRVCNATPYDFVWLEWDRESERAPLTSGVCTDYVDSPNAVPYTSVRLAIGDDVFQYQVIDYYGEPLESGRWSYLIEIGTYDARALSVRAVED